MIAMSKYEMIQYLSDYLNLQILFMRNPNEKIGKLFKMYMERKNIDNCNREYYDRMRRVYMIYMAMKKYSIAEDFLLNRDNYLNNNELEDIIPRNTYSTDLNGLINKKILQLIRDGFNHNNDIDNIDRFKISSNGKNIEIEFLNIKRSDGSFRPIKMKFSSIQLIEIYNDMISKRQNSLNISFIIPNDLDINSDDLYSKLGEIKFVHYYFKNKLPSNIIEKFNYFNKTKGLSKEELLQLSTEFNNLSSSIDIVCEYDLTTEQKNKLIDYINKYKKLNKDRLSNEDYSLLYYFLLKIIPVPILKDKSLDNQMFFCERFMEDINKSYNQILNEAQQMLKGNNPFSMDDSFDQETFKLFNKRKNFDNMSLIMDMLDVEMIVGFPAITYIDSVITHCCKNDEIIDLGNNQYEVEKVRNSLVHGRWFISTDNSIVLFDADPRNIKDYDLEYVGKIHINTLKIWADKYLKNNINVINRRK